MAVNFNVIGIFYQNSVDYSAFPGNTVADVMNYLVRTDPDFSFTTQGSGTDTIVTGFTDVKTQPFTGRTGINYPAGTYTLPDPNGSPNTPNSYAVWQYYLADENNVRRPVSGDTSFTVSEIGDGWSIFWRLVQISNQPVSTRKRYRKTIPQSGRTLQGIS